jgi:hypothetical protein
MIPTRPAASTALRAILVLSIAGVGGCSATTSGSAAPTSVPSSAPIAIVPATPVLPSDSPAASPEASATDNSSTSGSPEPTAVPTDLDPCALVTRNEASALVGFTVSPASKSTDNNTKICSYGQEGLVLQVLVAVAPDAATAKAREPEFKAQLEDGASKAGIKDVKLTELPDFEPGVDAAVIRGSASAAGLKVSGTAIYALKGAVFVAISVISIGGAVPTSEDMQAQAKTALGRVP